MLELFFLKIDQTQIGVDFGYPWFQVAQFFVGLLGLGVAALGQGSLPFLGVLLNLIGTGGLGSGIEAGQTQDE